MFVFCKYFHEKISDDFKGTNIGGFSRLNEAAESYRKINEFLKKDHSDPNFELNIGNFVDSTVRLFKQLANFDLVSNQLHMENSSEFIFKFLNSMLKSGLKINKAEIPLEGKNLLRIIHSQLSMAYNVTIPDHITAQVSSQVGRIVNGNGILKRTSKEFMLARDDVSCIKLKRNIEKKEKNNNHAKICKIHLEENTAPKHFFFRNFPNPTIKNNEAYMKEFNEIILESQVKFLKLDEKYFLDEVAFFEGEIQNNLDVLKRDEKLNEINLNDVYSVCQDIVQNDLKPVFKRAANKAANCKQIPYTTKEFEHYFNPNIKKNGQRDIHFDDSSMSQSSGFSGRSGRGRGHGRGRGRGYGRQRSQQRHRSRSRNNYSSHHRHHENYSSQRFNDSQRDSRDGDNYPFRQRNQNYKDWRNEENDYY